MATPFNKYLLLVLVALFVMVGVARAVEIEVNVGAKQVSVMEAPGEHFIMLGTTISQEVSGFTVYASAMFDFEKIDALEAVGERLEVGVNLPIGESGSLKMSAVKDSPFTHLDTETIAVMGSYKF